MSITHSTPARVLGCDVGKTSIVVADAAKEGRTFTVRNTPEALAAFAATLDGHTFVVCEATGGYELALLAALTAAGVPAHRGDARRIKAYVRSLGKIAKTDALDAGHIARYGAERQASLPRWRPADAENTRLQALVLLRRDLVADRTAWTNRAAAPGAGPARASIQRLVDTLDTEIATLDAAITTLIARHRALAAAVEVLTSIKGIGLRTAAALVALLPELGRIDRRQIASLAGLAPHPRQSGSSNAYRPTRGGRPDVKTILFLPALVAARSNPTFKAAYERLLANGKKPMVALTALMPKILVSQTPKCAINSPLN